MDWKFAYPPSRLPNWLSESNQVTDHARTALTNDSACAAAALSRQQSFWLRARIRDRSMKMIKLLLFLSKIIYNLQTIQDTKIIFAAFVAIYMLNKPAKFEQNALMVTEVIFRYKMRQLQTRFSQEKYNSTWCNILAITFFLDEIGTSFKWHCRANRPFRRCIAGMGPRPSGSRPRPRPRPELPRPRRDRDVCQTVRDRDETLECPRRDRDETFFLVETISRRMAYKCMVYALHTVSQTKNPLD